MPEINVTFMIIALTVATSAAGWNNDRLQHAWMFNPYRINRRREWYRFISSGFIHANLWHLFFNMITFYFFGTMMERIYRYYFEDWGTVWFLVTYLAGIVAASIKTYLEYRDEPSYNSLGASGGVSAVLFSAILYQPTAGICIYFALCIPAFILGILYLIYTYYQGQRGTDSINHDAHLYGSLFGIAITIAIRPAVIMEFIEHLRHFNLDGFRFFMISLLPTGIPMSGI